MAETLIAPDLRKAYKRTDPNGFSTWTYPASHTHQLIERVSKAEQENVALKKLCQQQHEALEKSLWRPRAQFPSNPYCALCGVGRKWAIDHGHERDCLITEYAALFPKTG